MRREIKKGRGGPREGSGRRSLPMNQKQRNRVVMNLTDEEYTALGNAASDAPLAAFTREIMLRYLARRRK